MFKFILNLFAAKPPVTFTAQLDAEYHEAITHKAASEANAAFCLQQLEHHEAEVAKAQRVIDCYHRMQVIRAAGAVRPNPPLGGPVHHFGPRAY